MATAATDCLIRSGEQAARTGATPITIGGWAEAKPPDREYSEHDPLGGRSPATYKILALFARSQGPGRARGPVWNLEGGGTVWGRRRLLTAWC